LVSPLTSLDFAKPDGNAEAGIEAETNTAKTADVDRKRFIVVSPRRGVRADLRYNECEARLDMNKKPEGYRSGSQFDTQSSLAILSAPNVQNIGKEIPDESSFVFGARLHRARIARA